MNALKLELPPQLRDMPLFQNSLLAWGMAIGTGVVFMACLLAARGFVRRQHREMTTTEHTELLEIPFEILSRTTLAFFVILSLVAGLSTLDMADGTRRVLTSAFMIVFFVQIGVWAGAAVIAWLERQRRRTSTAADRAVAGSLGIIGFIARLLIWSLVALMILDNLGIDVTALVAGLGIGGIAVALAAQNILGDLFASLLIAFDKPFLVGDFLILEDYLGSVEHIGIKSTRLRSGAASGDGSFRHVRHAADPAGGNSGHSSSRRRASAGHALRSQPLCETRHSLAGFRERVLRAQR